MQKAREKRFPFPKNGSHLLDSTRFLPFPSPPSPLKEERRERDETAEPPPQIWQRERRYSLFSALGPGHYGSLFLSGNGKSSLARLPLPFFPSSDAERKAMFDRPSERSLFSPSSMGRGDVRFLPERRRLDSTFFCNG